MSATGSATVNARRRSAAVGYDRRTGALWGPRRPRRPVVTHDHVHRPSHGGPPPTPPPRSVAAVPAVGSRRGCAGPAGLARPLFGEAGQICLAPDRAGSQEGDRWREAMRAGDGKPVGALPRYPEHVGDLADAGQRGEGGPVELDGEVVTGHRLDTADRGGRVHGATDIGEPPGDDGDRAADGLDGTDRSLAGVDGESDAERLAEAQRRASGSESVEQGGDGVVVVR